MEEASWSLWMKQTFDIDFGQKWKYTSMQSAVWLQNRKIDFIMDTDDIPLELID